MSSKSATRRASSTAELPQHALERAVDFVLPVPSVPLASPLSSDKIVAAVAVSGQTFNVTPITSCPWCLSKAATTELSTPPLIATTMRAICPFNHNPDALPRLPQ